MTKRSCQVCSILQLLRLRARLSSVATYTCIWVILHKADGIFKELFIVRRRWENYRWCYSYATHFPSALCRFFDSQAQTHKSCPRLRVLLSLSLSLSISFCHHLRAFCMFPRCSAESQSSVLSWSSKSYIVFSEIYGILFALCFGRWRLSTPGL